MEFSESDTSCAIVKVGNLPELDDDSDDTCGEGFCGHGEFDSENFWSKAGETVSMGTDEAGLGDRTLGLSYGAHSDSNV